MAGFEQYVTNGKWYDAANPGPLHDDLRRDYARTKANAAKRPSLVRHMNACGECQSIGQATASAPPPHAGRRRLKLQLDKAQMHARLGLPDNFEIVHMWADNDPNVVTVLVAGEGLPETAADAEALVGQLDELRGDAQS